MEQYALGICSKQGPGAWTHLPVILETQEEILNNLAIKGDAFSVSALPMGNEVYLNDGEDVGTRLSYNSNRQGIFCLNSEKDAQVKICEMKSIWK